MGWAIWGPSIVSSLVLSAIGLAAGYFLKAAVEKSVQHGFDRELESLKAQLKKDEENYRAELKARDEQLVAIRSTALQALGARQSALAERRLKAAEILWTATVAEGRFRMLLAFFGSLNIDAMLDATALEKRDSQKYRNLAEGLWQSANLDKMIADTNQVADKERLFLSPKAWAAYSAYRSINGYAVVTISAMKLGLGKNILKDGHEALKLVKEVLPNYADMIEKFGINAFHHLTEPLESIIYSELINGISSNEYDIRSLNEAASLIKLANSANDAVVAAKIPEIPDELKSATVPEKISPHKSR